MWLTVVLVDLNDTFFFLIFEKKKIMTISEYKEGK